MHALKKTVFMSLAFLTLGVFTEVAAEDLNVIRYNQSQLFAIETDGGSPTRITPSAGTIFNPLSPSAALAGLPVLTAGQAGTTSLAQGTLNGGKLVSDPLDFTPPKTLPIAVHPTTPRGEINHTPANQ